MSVLTKRVKRLYQHTCFMEMSNAAMIRRFGKELLDWAMANDSQTLALNEELSKYVDEAEQAGFIPPKGFYMLGDKYTRLTAFFVEYDFQARRLWVQCLKRAEAAIMKERAQLASGSLESGETENL